MHLLQDCECRYSAAAPVNFQAEKVGKLFMDLQEKRMYPLNKLGQRSKNLRIREEK